MKRRDKLDRSTPSVSTVIKEIIRSREFLIIFGLLAALFSFVTYNTSGIQGEEFATLSILGGNLKADDYFHSNDRTIGQGDNISWYVNVSNHMHSAEYVSVRIKLLNSTQIIPNDGLNRPSPETELLEFRSMLAKNSTWVVPLSWSIKEADKDMDYVVIREVTLNGQDISNLNIRSLSGENFRMVLELWHYDTDAKDFTFVWSSGHESRSVWNQIWFNVKI